MTIEASNRGALTEPVFVFGFQFIKFKLHIFYLKSVLVQLVKTCVYVQMLSNFNFKTTQSNPLSKNTTVSTR